MEFMRAKDVLCDVCYATWILLRIALVPVNFIVVPFIKVRGWGGLKQPWASVAGHERM